MSNPGGRRRRRWILAVGILLVLLAWSGVLAAKTWSAYRHDQQGLAQLDAVRANLDPGQVTAASTQRSLETAEAEFDAARADLSSPLFAPVTLVPVIGRQFSSVRALSTAAGQVSAVGASFLGDVHQVLDLPHSAGPERVASLERLSALSLSSARQLSGIDTGPGEALVSPLARKHEQFDSQLATARTRLADAAAVSAVTATILQGPETYLVLAANNAEMRAGSGAFLDIGVATTTNGAVQLGDLGPSGALTLPVGVVTATGDLERNWGWLLPGVDFRNLGVTPQFDVTAPLAARMWQAATGQHVDGVLAIDVAGLQQILSATGPVEVAGQSIGAGDVEQYLLHDQYAGLTDSTLGVVDREDQLGALASAVLRQLQGESTDLRSLASAVTGAVAGRHLMLWSSSPAAQAAWVASGVSGTIASDSLAVTVINRGGNKLDQYLPVSVGVDTRPSGAGTEVTVTTTLVNQTPDGQSQVIAGPYPGLPVSYGEYTGIIAENLPAVASDITLTGASPLSAKGGEGPTWLIAAPFTLVQGATRTVVVRFHLPTPHGSMTVVPSARIPAEQWTAGGRTFSDARPEVIAW